MRVKPSVIGAHFLLIGVIAPWIIFFATAKQEHPPEGLAIVVAVALKILVTTFLGSLGFFYSVPIAVASGIAFFLLRLSARYAPSWYELILAMAFPAIGIGCSFLIIDWWDSAEEGFDITCKTVGGLFGIIDY